MRVFPFCSCFGAVLPFLFLFVAQADDDDLLKKLKAVDVAYLASLKAAGSTSMSFNYSPSLNRTVKFRLTSIDNRQAVESSEPVPAFQQEPSKDAFGGSFKIDADGRMNVIVPSSTVFLFDHDLCGEAIMHSAWRVDSSNKAVEIDKSYSIWQFSSDNLKNAYSLLQPLLTMGRGFSEYIDLVESVSPEASPAGPALRVKAVGKCVSPGQGQWNLLVVPGEAYLVREASYSIEGAPEPLFRLSNTGKLEHDELLVASAGRFQIGPDAAAAVYEIAVDSASLEGDEEFMKLVRDRVVDNLPPHSFVEDQRVDPPRTYRINEEGVVRGDSAGAVASVYDPDNGRPLTQRTTFRFLMTFNVLFFAVLFLVWSIRKWRAAK